MNFVVKSRVKLLEMEGWLLKFDSVLFCRDRGCVLFGVTDE